MLPSQVTLNSRGLRSPLIEPGSLPLISQPEPSRWDRARRQPSKLAVFCSIRLPAGILSWWPLWGRILTPQAQPRGFAHLPPHSLPQFPHSSAIPVGCCASDLLTLPLRDAPPELLHWLGKGAPHLLQMFAGALGGVHSTLEHLPGVHPMGRGSVARGSVGLRPDGTGLAVWFCGNRFVVWKVFQPEYRISRSPSPAFPPRENPGRGKIALVRFFSAGGGGASK